MAYLTATGTNQPLLGAIKIESTKATGGQTDATSVRIKRRDMSGSVWTTLTTFDVSNVDGLTFSFLDKNVLTGRTYRYAITPVVGSTEQAAVNVNVTCLFNSIFISDTSGDYMASLNIAYKASKNIPVSYVQPLSSKYPHAVRNSLANYFSGNVEGIFIPFTTDCLPDTTNMNAYKDSAIEMLSNGLVKTLRTYDGHGWLVNIDGEPSRNTDGFYNADTISFNWTEVGVFPTTGVVML